MQNWGKHEVKGSSYHLHSYPVHDLCSLSTYLHLSKECNKLCLLCWLKLLKFSSWDKLISRKKCKHKNEISHFYPNLFISLTYIPASGSTEVKQEEKSGSAAKKPRLDPTGEPGTSGVSNTRKTRKFKGKDKKKITFEVDWLSKNLIITTCTVCNYPIAWYFKDQSCKISLQTWRTFNLSSKIVSFVMNFYCYWLTISYNPISGLNKNHHRSVWFNISYLIIWGICVYIYFYSYKIN